MRKPHRVFQTAEHDSQMWRYFDLPKFLSFLQYRALYFCRCDLIGDPLEGSFTKARLKERDQELNKLQGVDREHRKRALEHEQKSRQTFPRCVYLNCWHLGEHESMAMWKGYGGGNYGVAIQSTFGLLNELLIEEILIENQGIPIHLGKVRYVDHNSETESVPVDNLFEPFTRKSVAYCHENEVRAIFSVFDNWMEVPSNVNHSSRMTNGHFVPVDISRLVQKVVVSPYAEDWYENLIRDTCLKFGFTLQVTSSLVSKPAF